MNLSPGQKKLVTYGVPIVAVLGIVMYLRSRGSTTAPATTGTTPAASTSVIDSGQLADFENNVNSQLSGFAATLASPTNPSVPISDPTAASGSGTTSVSVLPIPVIPSPKPAASSVAQALGFTNPSTPVALIGGQLIDTSTGRVAFYGPGGQPGSASPVAGGTSWIDPTGKTVYFNPNSYGYSDPTRAPDLPPAPAVGLFAGSMQ